MMDRSIFDPERQQQDVASKIVAGLERISEVFKVLLWEKAKERGLSPIQIQLLLFVAFHKDRLCKVSHLAKEFNITKATVSDAVKTLEKKGLIIKDFSSADSRSYTIHLSDLGKRMVAETGDFANPIKRGLDNFDAEDLEGLYKTLAGLIHKLNRSGILTVQRICYGCAFHQKNGDTDYCNLLGMELQHHDIRLDCPEFEENDQD